MLASHPQLVGELHVAQVQGRVVDDVQDAPADRDTRPLASRVPSRSVSLSVENISRVSSPTCSRRPTSSDALAARVANSASRSREGGRPPTTSADPEMLRTGDMRCQDSQRVGGMLLRALQGTPVQGLGGQARDQVADLPRRSSIIWR